MNEKQTSEHGIGTRAAVLMVFFASMLAILLFFAEPLRQFIR
jgi:hypothetical protein